MVNNEFKKELKKEFNVNSICIYNPLNKKEIIKKSKNKSKIFKTNNLKILNIGRLLIKDHLTLKTLSLLKNKIKFEAVIIGKGVLKRNYLIMYKQQIR